MPDPITLLDLPAEVLVPTLAHLGDVPSVVNVGCVCHHLYDLITGTEGVWQALFLLKYDDPRRAAAFLVPRTSKFDWKQGVIDRDDTIHFFEQDWPKENKEVMARWAMRVCRTILDLYLDLPPLGEASLNLPILVSLVVNENVLGYLCRTSNFADANHLEALFNCLPSFRRDIDRDVDSDFQVMRFVGWKGIDPYFDRQELWLWGEDTPKWALAATASLCLAPMRAPRPPSSHLPDAWYTNDYERGKDICFFESRRGQALSVLSLGRPRDLPADKVWDWAGVGGTWCGVATVPPRPRIIRDDIDFTAIRITDLSLSVVSSRSEVAQAYSAKAGDTNDTALWADFDDLNMDANLSHPLQPVFFHGTYPLPETGMFTRYPSISGRGGRQLQFNSAPGQPQQMPPRSQTPPPRALDDHEEVGAFIHGAVYLTKESEPDSPPQVRYTIVFTHRAHIKPKVLRAVQPWGPCSRGGLLGSYTDGGNNPIPPVGFMWLWK